jgi:hypothetical protein
MKMDTPERSKVGGAPLSNKFEVFFSFSSPKSTWMLSDLYSFSIFGVLFVGLRVQDLFMRTFKVSWLFMLCCWIWTDLLENLNKTCLFVTRSSTLSIMVLRFRMLVNLTWFCFSSDVFLDISKSDSINVNQKSLINNNFNSLHSFTMYVHSIEICWR